MGKKHFDIPEQRNLARRTTEQTRTGIVCLNRQMKSHEARMALNLKHRGVTNMPALRAGQFRGYLDSVVTLLVQRS